MLEKKNDENIIVPEISFFSDGSSINTLFSEYFVNSLKGDAKKKNFFPSLNYNNNNSISSEKKMGMSFTNDNVEIIIKKNLHCLLVDDTPFNNLILEKYILDIDKNIRIGKAFNGKEAIDYFENPDNRNVDIIYMDINMPVMDGYDATRMLLRKMKENEINEAPIIAVTAYAAEDEEKKCYEVGMSDFIRKPVSKMHFYQNFDKWSKICGVKYF